MWRLAPPAAQGHAVHGQQLGHHLVHVELFAAGMRRMRQPPRGFVPPRRTDLPLVDERPCRCACAVRLVDAG
jgi:hypothetical protein